MKTKFLITMLALGASTGLLLAQDGNPPMDGQQPPALDGGQGGPGGHGGGRGGPGGGIHLLPPGAAQKLNLTDDQKKQVAALETEMKAKLEKILTPDQLKQLKSLRPPRMRGGQGGGPDGQGGPGGPGGQGGGPDGGPGGPGGQGGPGDQGGPGGGNPPPGNN